MLTTLRRYRALLVVLLPFAFLRLLWRSRLDARYRQHWAERLGYYPLHPQKPIIWLHAVSVGETRAATILVPLLRTHYPQHQLLITHMTPTGRATSPELNGDVLRAYLPYDLPSAVARFLAHFKPALGLLLETELWPHLIAACRNAQVPLLLVNARLSEKSAAGYGRHQPLAGNALRGLSLIAAQTFNDAQRIKDLGAQDVVVSGNLKFDASTPDTIPTDLPCWNIARPVWMAASTRPGEEALLLNLLPRLNIPNALLVLVPRHPQRFAEVAALLQAHGIDFVRRSEGRPVPDNVPVLLGDSMGEMSAYYQSVDVAVIGGSLLPFGGQNLIEATAVGCPAIVGPHTYNFHDAADFAVAAGAAVRVLQPNELLTVLPDLLGNHELRQRMGDAGRHFTLAHRGAAQNILTLIQRFLPVRHE